MLAQVRTLFQPFHKLLVAGAWFFIIFSLLRLAWALGVKLDSPEGITMLYYTVIGDEVYDAWGLTYSGTTGLIQVFMHRLRDILPARYRLRRRRLRRV